MDKIKAAGKFNDSNFDVKQTSNSSYFSRCYHCIKWQLQRSWYSIVHVSWTNSSKNYRQWRNCVERSIKMRYSYHRGNWGHFIELVGFLCLLLLIKATKEITGKCWYRFRLSGWSRFWHLFTPQWIQTRLQAQYMSERLHYKAFRLWRASWWWSGKIRVCSRKCLRPRRKPLGCDFLLNYIFLIEIPITRLVEYYTKSFCENHSKFCS